MSIGPPCTIGKRTAEAAGLNDQAFAKKSKPDTAAPGQILTDTVAKDILNNNNPIKESSCDLNASPMDAQPDAVNIETIQRIANSSWNTGVPRVAPASNEANDLENLSDLASFVKSAFVGMHLTNDASSAIDMVVDRCWKHSLAIKDPSTALKACLICFEKLADRGASDVEYRKSFIFTFGESPSAEDKIELPNYYRKILGKASPYFGAMFQEEGFKESTADAVPLHWVTRQQFETMLKMLAEGASALDCDLEELLGFTAQAHRLQMSTVFQLARDTLIETIGQFDCTHEHMEISFGLLERLPRIENDRKVREAIANYHAKVTRSCNTSGELEALLAFCGEKITGLDLTDSCDLGDQQVGELIKKCPNLIQIIIKSKMITDQTVARICTSFPALQMLELRRCNRLFSESLTRLTALTALQTLNLRQCH